MISEASGVCQSKENFAEFLASEASSLVNSANLDWEIKQLLIAHKKQHPAYAVPFWNKANIDSIRKILSADDTLQYFALSYPGYTEFKVKRTHSSPEISGGERKPITSFSRSSRRNLIKKFLRLTEYPNLWVTFTYADTILDQHYNCEYPGIEALCKRANYDLNRWTKRANGYFDFYIWRRETETRKSGPWAGYEFPHFHVMLKVPENKAVPHVLLSMWHKIACPGDERHKQVTMHSRSFDWLDGWRHVQGYISKYCAKESGKIEIVDPETGEVRFAEIGRCWGFSRSAPIAPAEYIPMQENLFAQLKRTARRHMKAIFRARDKSISKALDFKLTVKDVSFSWFLPQGDLFRLLLPPPTDPLATAPTPAPF